MNTTQFDIPTKTTWKTDLSKTWDELFYPSVVRKIKKDEPRLQEIFEIREQTVDEDIFTNEFLPLYDKEISSRSDYHLNRAEQVQKITDKMKSGVQFYVYGVHLKSDNSFKGGYLFQIKEEINAVAVTFRVFDRELSQKHKQNVTVDFWAEAQFIEYCKKYNKPVFTHGRDTHPRIGGIGLPLFKLKLGARPFLPLPEEYEMKTYTEDEFTKSSEPVFFFDDLKYKCA